MSEHTAENDVGVLTPRCPRCGWQADGLPDVPENHASMVALVSIHKSVCPGLATCRACREGAPAEVAPCLCPIPSAKGDEQ